MLIKLRKLLKLTIPQSFPNFSSIIVKYISLNQRRTNLGCGQTDLEVFREDILKKILLELGISVIDVRTFYRENHQPGLIQVTHAYDAFTAHPAVTLNSAS
jgi:hypothetical protein